MNSDQRYLHTGEYQKDLDPDGTFLKRKERTHRRWPRDPSHRKYRRAGGTKPGLGLGLGFRVKIPACRRHKPDKGCFGACSMYDGGGGQNARSRACTHSSFTTFYIRTTYVRVSCANAGLMGGSTYVTVFYLARPTYSSNLCGPTLPLPAPGAAVAPACSGESSGRGHAEGPINQSISRRGYTGRGLPSYAYASQYQSHFTDVKVHPRLPRVTNAVLHLRGTRARQQANDSAISPAPPRPPRRPRTQINIYT